MKDLHLSKFLSLILRHRPEALDITLDPNGWADVREILEKMNNRGMKVDLNHIEHIVATNNKKRFILTEDRQKIRANQGHSIAIDMEFKPIQPPDKLYHGTATRFLDSIREKGLMKGNRQHVHLSADQDTAVLVGKRHGKPVVITIDTGKMWANGHEFYLSENKVWLTDGVPVEYLFIP